MVKIETTNSTQIDEKGGKQTLLIGKNAIYAIPETGWRTVITNTDHVSPIASTVNIRPHTGHWCYTVSVDQKSMMPT